MYEKLFIQFAIGILSYGLLCGAIGYGVGYYIYKKKDMSPEEGQ